MKSLCFLVTTLTLTFTAQKSQAQTDTPKMLIVYYSWSGNTEAVGRHIQSLTGADVFEIVPEKPYPSDYKECTDVAKREINAGYKPAIKGTVPDLDGYDVIFVGTPNWWSTMAPPVATFLAENKLSGKTIAPFVTHGGGRQARCFTDMQKECPDASFRLSQDL